MEYSKIYRTDQEGSVIFKIKNNRLEIETCNPWKGVTMKEEINKTYEQIESKILQHEIYQNVKDYRRK